MADEIEERMSKTEEDLDGDKGQDSGRCVIVLMDSEAGSGG